MGYISQMLKRTTAYGAYKKYMKKLVDPLYNRVSFKSNLVLTLFYLSLFLISISINYYRLVTSLIPMTNLWTFF